MKPRVEPTHYFNKFCETKERFISYWHQTKEIIRLNPKRVLEIGIGNSFVSGYLRKRGVNLTTLDIDKRLNPGVVGSVLRLPFSNESFGAVACYEVLEHLPCEDFPKALSEIHRVSSSHAVLSVPDSTRAYRLDIQILKIGELRMLI